MLTSLRPNGQPRPGNSRGFGLIELMVSIVIGLIVVAGITSMVVSVLRTNNNNLEMTRLTQELRAAVQLISREVRRASYTSDSLLNIGAMDAAAFSDISFFDDSTEVNFLTNPTAGPADCIFFSYDEDEDGSLGAGDFRGFRLNEDQDVIEMLDTDTGSCTTGTWNDLTNPNQFVITNLAFYTDGEENFGCVLTDEIRVVIRDIVVSVSGQLADAPEVSRTVTGTITVRNDQLTSTTTSCPT